MSLVRFRPEAYADLAHLVERDLAKVEVAGSSPVIRSMKKALAKASAFFNEAHLRCIKNEAAFGYEACLRHTERLECASLHGNEVAALYERSECIMSA